MNAGLQRSALSTGKSNGVLAIKWILLTGLVVTGRNKYIEQRREKNTGS